MSSMLAGKPNALVGRQASTSSRSGRRGLVVSASWSNGNEPRPPTTLHRLIESEGCLLVPGVYDALSAKILQRTGHKAGFVSGAGVSATLLGEPDLGLLTPPEMARKTSQVCTSVPELPIIADADTGGGNVLNVQRTVRSLIAAGAKGCVLEDQSWPKKTGHMRNKEVIAMEEFVAKVLAAREAIGDSDFFLVARTDARGISAKHGVDDAVARANLYVDAGADATLVEAPRSVEELRAIGERTKGLRVVNMLEGGVTPLAPLADLTAWGFHVVVYPLSGMYTATRALMDVYGHLAESGSSQGSWDSMVSWRAFNDVLGLEDKYAVEEHFTKVRGPASSVEQRLKVRVKAMVKPVSGN